MSEKRYEDMTPDEQLQYDITRYLGITDNKTALDALKAEITTRRQGYGEVWATGFSELDAKLDGGFMGEQLIFLGAISSLGKTSFALQIATQIAEQGKDVLIFSLEMSKNELNAKTISRYTHILTEKDQYRQKYRLTTRDILSGRVGGVAFDQAVDMQGEVFIQALEATEKLAGNIRIFVGNNDVSVDKVRDAVDIHIRATNKRPFVILDYLQILQPTDELRTTEKRLLTDYDVTSLKVVSREFHIPVLVISAFNRTNYLEPVSMSSFRESSGIEYSSDILLAMQYHGMDYQKHWFTTKSGKAKKVYESIQDHNTRVRGLLDQMDRDGADGVALPIELKILKNRNGTKGSLFYDFLPAYSYYSEGMTRPYKTPPEYEPDDESSTSSVVSTGAVTIGSEIR